MNNKLSALPLNSNIGIIGGGQLARMLAMDIARLGFHAHIFTSEQNPPAAEVAKYCTISNYDDESALRAFADNVAVITNEFENIPARTAKILAGLKPLYPSPDLFAICQNRAEEKQFIRKAGAQTANFAIANSASELREAISEIGLPCIVKTTTLGYDGKGQIRLYEPQDYNAQNCEDLWQKLGSVELIIEAFVPFEREASIIIARDLSGEVQTFPIAENFHENGILRQSTAPATINKQTAQIMRNIAQNIAITGKLIGILAVECFILSNGEVIVNELAARPHNSGHFTMDGCNISQFEMLARICAGLPMIEPKLLRPVRMLNILGDEVNNLNDYLINPNARLHLYGKIEAKSGRKMAHINILG
jgi:5-(carboxyamino)imidazole ribonucleotide synthase